MARRSPPPRFEPDVPSTASPPRRRRGGFGRFLFWLDPASGAWAPGAGRRLPVPAAAVTILMLQRAGEDGLRKDWRPLDRIDADLVHAVVAAEDSRFCAHRGFDVEAIRKAMEANETSSKVRGGSTISQQTAKNVFLWPQRSWVRKGLEAGFTVLIETIWGKPRIMEVYLNVIEFAPGVYGAEAAAQRWFGKSAEDLTRTEAARLAAILPAPRRYKAASPGPYVRRRSGRIAAAIQVVRDDGLSACAFDGRRRAAPGDAAMSRPRRANALAARRCWTPRATPTRRPKRPATLPAPSRCRWSRKVPTSFREATRRSRLKEHPPRTRPRRLRIRRPSLRPRPIPRRRSRLVA
jgi:monofunctional biosynthetic peptidoglycan transglycosylase